MPHPRYKIVFDGELMPGMATDSVKSNLARLFKSDLARIDSLFSNVPVSLKRDLDEAEAEQYIAALQKAGVQVRKEAEPAQASSLSLVPTDDHQNHESPTETSASTQMHCPKCGHEQTRANECVACGIIIAKYLARQAQLAEQPQPAITTPPPTGNASPYAPPQANVAERLPEFGELKVFGVTGRIGRVRYLGWLMAMTLCFIPILVVGTGFAAFSSTLGMLVIGLISLAAIVISIFIGVQRLHDIGWSGWLLLVHLIPVVGSVFALLMLIIPGTQGANRFGPPPPPNSTSVKILAWLFLLIPISGIVAAIAIPQYQGYAERAAEYQER